MDTPLRTRRIRASLTLAQVSEAVGLSQAQLSRIETGAFRASPDAAERLAKYFGDLSEIEILYPERYRASA